jgi:hypothetical protein
MLVFQAAKAAQGVKNQLRLIKKNKKEFLM